MEELKAAMQSLGFEQKNPTIYNMIAELDYDNREVDFEEFLGAIIDKLGDKVQTNLIYSIPGNQRRHQQDFRPLRRRRQQHHQPL